MTDFVTYRTQTGATMRAAVRIRHRNGDVTVEPFFYQKDGRDTGLFQGGHEIRLKADRVTPWTAETMANRFAAKCADANGDDVLYFDFDPKATEDQEGDVGIITFSDGSKWFNDAATGKTWTA